MLYEPTTLAATAAALAEAVQAYGCEPAVLFRRAGLDMGEMQTPGARYRLRDVMRLWTVARLETEDPCIGLYAARLASASGKEPPPEHRAVTPMPTRISTPDR